MQSKTAKIVISEIIGTLILVFVGCGTAAVTGCSGAPDASYILTALAFGLVIVVIAYSLGRFSGAHVNPAVSLGMWLDGRIGFVDFIVYIVSQFVGAIIGAGLLALLIGANTGLGTNHLVAGGDIGATIGIELFLTFIFVLAVLGATSKTEDSSVAGIAIGLSLAVVHILGISFTGTSVNPARTLGPALFVGGDALAAAPVIILATLLGGLLAALVWGILNGSSVFTKKAAPEKAEKGANKGKA